MSHTQISAISLGEVGPYESHPDLCHQSCWSCQPAALLGKNLNPFLMGYIQLCYLPCIKCLGLPVSVSCPVYRNVNDKEIPPVVSVSKGCASLL